ncbi:MAG: SDR family NAD(P)-dependent oxidoreductase [Myxococcales bacterium]|nr:SDR family NAD(P)-dependent oxidoreductase [Myxococcales bacterium]
MTGASSGIGEAICRAFAQQGARVVLSARRGKELERIRRTLPSPNDHLVYTMDLSRRLNWEEAATIVQAQCGPIDIFVHSCGRSQRSSAHETTMDVDRQLMELNYFSAVGLTKALLPSMIQRGRGHLVPISSVSGRVSPPFRSAYAASKHALHGFFDAIRAENHHNGIKVTIICPGYVRTHLSENAATHTLEPYGQMDATTARGISPERCAQRVLKGIARCEEEVLVGGRETWAVYLKCLAPRLLSRIIRRGNRP